MTSTTGAVARCADGTEVSFDWVYEDAPAYEWLRDRSHWPDPMVPMELWLWYRGLPGIDRAWEEAELIAPPVFRRFQLVGPFLYARMTPPSPEQLAAMAPGYVAASQKHGGALNFWKTYCEPRIVGACDELAAMEPGVDLGAAAETLFYGFHQTFTSLALLALPNLRLGEMLKQVLGDDAELTGFEVTQGGENATLDVDDEIWRLSELARETPAVSRILASDRDDALDALRREPGAAEFVREFVDLIARRGRRSQAWALTSETWNEQPEAALALVRAQTQADRVSPDELRARSEQRRREATERVLAALPPERHDEFHEIVRGLDGYVSIREGRAYWQLVISGAMRGLLLRIGEQLVLAGRVNRADDILYITPDDYLPDPSSDLRPKVAAGRAQWERWLALEPPPIIGTPGDVAAEAAKRGDELRGSPASRGVATGTARVLRSPEEGDRLQHGDILVCVMTTPAWTPLFAIAGGIVTETGGALSHPAITAREYGIPAVVALQGATTRIRDGERITIDGGSGVVSAEG
jgi:phosphohistidine swiveling domain-containing protein